MIIKTEIKIDYLEEGGNLDQAIKEELVKRCVSVLEKNVMKELNGLIKKSFLSKIENNIDDILKDFLFSKPIRITDSWGDAKENYENGLELMKTKFDNFINQEVDDKGDPIISKQCGYGNRHDSRINYLIKKFMYSDFNRVIKEVEKSVKTELENKIKDIKANLVKETLSTLYDKIDIEAGIKSKTER